MDAGRQRNILVYVCVHLSVDMYLTECLLLLSVCSLHNWVDFKEVEVELASVIRFTYPTFSNGLPRAGVYGVNENLVEPAHSSLEPLIVTR